MQRMRQSAHTPPWQALSRALRAASLAWIVCISAAAQAQGYVPIQGDLLLQGRPAEGLVILRSGYRNSSLIDADSLVFFGASDSQRFGDVLSMSVGIREPHGYGRMRIGRFLLSTGAVRPVHVDGASITARAPSDTSLELFAGAPVTAEFGERSFDWLAGARLSQRLLNERVGIGASYLQRRDAGELALHELGTDLSLRPAPWLSLAGLAAWDLLRHGLAEARLSSVVHDSRGQLELFVSRRVAARLLPATSLFTVIGQAPSSELGGAVHYRLFPRLDLAPSAAAIGLDGAWGYRVALRTSLRLSAAPGEQGGPSGARGGRVSLEMSRRKLALEGLSAAWLQLTSPTYGALSAHASFELVAADKPRGRGALWPWARAGLSYGLGAPWLVSGALGWKSTPSYRNDLYALLRVSFNAEVQP